jgi:hypothetical protein
MKTRQLPTLLSHLPVLLLAVSTLPAQPASPPAAKTPAPLGLLRLQESSKPGQAAALAAAKFAVDDLSVGAAPGASKARKGEVDVLSLDAHREWSRPLRGAGREVAFVSFQLYASAGTIVDVAGARLGITISPVTGSVQLMIDESSAGALQWKPLNTHIGTGRFDGRTFSALPTLTLRLDPASDTWDLYLGSRLVADHRPLIAAKKDDRRFVVRAGGEGAWLTGLVFADENPLYEDANANGIDDAFERQKRGALLAATASVSDRQSLAQEWKASQRQKAPPALYVKRPAADGAASKSPGS